MLFCNEKRDSIDFMMMHVEKHTMQVRERNFSELLRTFFTLFLLYWYYGQALDYKVILMV